MDTKPYSLQAPESIAKEYGGNKQKIAQAAGMGLLDPTAAVMAGMFIDRMRTAQTSEQGAPQTVAQQVFQPAVQPMPSPPMGGAPQMPGAPGMAPPAQMPGAPGMAPPPVGMAEGGLAALPVPDDMFEETDDYAGGGIVAFAEGGNAPAAPPTQDTFYGINASNPLANAAMYDQLFGPNNDQYTRETEQEYIRERSPEARKKRRSQDMWAALAQMGFNMAGSRAPTLLQAAGEAGSAALPGLMESTRERKAEDRELRRGLLDIERGRNTERAARAQGLLALQAQGMSAAEARAGRDLQERLQRENIASQERMQREQIAAQRAIAAMRSSGGGGGGGGGRPPNLSDFEGQVQARVMRMIADNSNLPYYRGSRAAGNSFTIGRHRMDLTTPGVRERNLARLEDYAMSQVRREMGRNRGSGGGGAETFPTSTTPSGWGDAIPIGG